MQKEFKFVKHASATRRNRTTPRHTGFSLVELLVVVAVAMIIGGMCGPPAPAAMLAYLRPHLGLRPNLRERPLCLTLAAQRVCKRPWPGTRPAPAVGLQ